MSRRESRNRTFEKPKMSTEAKTPETQVTPEESIETTPDTEVELIATDAPVDETEQLDDTESTDVDNVAVTETPVAETLAAETLTADTTETPTATEPEVVVDTPAVTAVTAEPVAVVDASAVATHINNLLDAYVPSMRPGYPVNPSDGALKQRQLSYVYKAVLGYTDGDFAVAFNALLARIDADRNGVFSEPYLFRFVSTAFPSPENRKFFETFTAFILRIHDPKSRGIVLKQTVNYVNVLKTVLKHEEAERLQGYIEQYV